MPDMDKFLEKTRSFLEKYFKDRSVGFYIAMGVALLALIVDILYVALDHADTARTFSWVGFALILVAFFSNALVIFTPFLFVPIVPSLLYSVGFGVILKACLPSISDIWNGVNFIGGNGELGIVFSALFGVIAILGVVTCFLDMKKTILLVKE